MNLRHLLTLATVALTAQANAENYRDMEPLTLEVPEMKAELVKLPERSAANFERVDPAASPKMDFDFFKTKTNPGVKAYKFMDDMTFVGIPLFAAGWAIKGDKAMFRVNQKAESGGKKNTQLLTDFKTGIDDYTQFFGPAMVVGLKLGGYEGRSDWPRLLASAGLSYAIMAGFVNGIKYQLVAFGAYGNGLRWCLVAPQGVWTHPLALVVGGWLWRSHGNRCDARAQQPSLD